MIRERLARDYIAEQKKYYKESLENAQEEDKEMKKIMLRNVIQKKLFVLPMVRVSPPCVVNVIKMKAGIFLGFGEVHANNFFGCPPGKNFFYIDEYVNEIVTRSTKQWVLLLEDSPLELKHPACESQHEAGGLSSYFEYFQEKKKSTLEIDPVDVRCLYFDPWMSHISSTGNAFRRPDVAYFEVAVMIYMLRDWLNRFDIKSFVSQWGYLPEFWQLEVANLLESTRKLAKKSVGELLSLFSKQFPFSKWEPQARAYVDGKGEQWDLTTRTWKNHKEAERLQNLLHDLTASVSQFQDFFAFGRMLDPKHKGKNFIYYAGAFHLHALRKLILRQGEGMEIYANHNCGISMWCGLAPNPKDVVRLDGS
jgi:hypothetical protein